MEQFTRQSDESYLKWISRIIDISDISKSETWNILFNTNISEDEARKRLYGVHRIVTNLLDEQETLINDHDLTKILDKKRADIEKEKVKLSDTRRIYKGYLRSESRLEEIKDFVSTVARNMDCREIKFDPSNIQIKENSNDNKHGVLLLSDFHSETTVDNFLNVYNKDVFNKRFEYLIEKAVQYGLHHNIDTLHVCNLNDLIGGIIHVTTRLASNEDVITQTMYISELLAETLAYLSTIFKNIKFYSVVDNHSRVHSDKSINMVKENFSRFIPWYIKSKLEPFDNIEVIDDGDPEIQLFKIFEFQCVMIHGHNDNVKNVVQDLSLMTKNILDYVFMAHYHHNVEDEVHCCDIICNPSMIGVDEYSKSIRRSSKPAQKFMIFDKELGRECTYNIRLDQINL